MTIWRLASPSEQSNAPKSAESRLSTRPGCRLSADLPATARFGAFPYLSLVAVDGQLWELMSGERERGGTTETS